MKFNNKDELDHVYTEARMNYECAKANLWRALTSDEPAEAIVSFQSALHQIDDLMSNFMETYSAVEQEYYNKIAVRKEDTAD